MVVDSTWIREGCVSGWVVGIWENDVWSVFNTRGMYAQFSTRIMSHMPQVNFSTNLYVVV